MKGGLGSLMHLKQRHPHLRVLLSIGGGSSVQTFPLAASSDAFRHNFASSAKGLVEASGLDGIDGKYSHLGLISRKNRVRPFTDIVPWQLCGNTRLMWGRG